MVTTEVWDLVESHLRPAGIFRNLLEKNVAVLSEIWNISQSVKSCTGILGRFLQQLIPLWANVGNVAERSIGPPRRPLENGS